MYKCEICNEEVENIGVHLRFCHKIKAKDYYDKFLKKSGEGKCKICNKDTKFITIENGYREYCCKKCFYKDPIIIEKIKQTKLEKYGDSNYNNIEKCKATCLERYGFERAQSSEIVKNKFKNTWKNKTPEEIEWFKEQHRIAWKNKTDSQKHEMAEKVKQTKLERYGDENYNNKEKNKQTCLEKYGVENVYQSEIIKSKIKQTLLERYGVEHQMHLPLTKSKIRQTCLERYGTESYLQTKECKDSIRNKSIQRALLNNDNIIDYFIKDNEVFFIYRCPHPECDKCNDKFYVSKSTNHAVRRYQNIEECTNLLPIQINKGAGTNLELFVREILDKNNIEYIKNDRSILKGKELDIYIPQKNLAIECNGVYWHSLKPKKYHYEKWNNCKEKNIQLLTIWGDQIKNKPDIVREIIKSKLGIYEQQVGARDCIIKNVTTKESNKFLEYNHLQGKINGSIRIGLYYKDELVSLMVFGVKRRALGNKNTDYNTYELYRYCNKLGWKISGGASKLFKYFLNENKNCIVESFSSNDISFGKLYKNLGFELNNIQLNSYWYIDKNEKRYHRYSFRKDVLVKMGYDKTKTESEITDEMGLLRIYDSGQQKWIYHNLL